MSFAVGAWVDVWRNLPLIFIILYLALTIPEAWPDAYEDAIPSWFPEGLRSSRVLAAILGLVLYNSAVLAEIMRAGILSLDRGQNEAARAPGLTYRQSMRFVVLPQGLRRMVPATVSQLITLNKDTTLVSIVAIQEVMRHGRIVTGANFFGGVQAPILQVFLLIGALFIAVNLGALAAVAAARGGRERSARQSARQARPRAGRTGRLRPPSVSSRGAAARTRSSRSRLGVGRQLGARSQAARQSDVRSVRASACT